MITAPIVVDSSKSLATNYTSPPISLDQQWGLSIQALWTGAPVGAFKLQTSLNYQPGGPMSRAPANAGTWDDYPGSSQNSSGANSCSWDITTTASRWIRVFYAAASGSGTLSQLLAEVKGV